jgi:hypothetical protein
MKLMFLEMLICRYIIFVWCLCKFENVLNYNIYVTLTFHIEGMYGVFDSKYCTCVMWNRLVFVLMLHWLWLFVLYVCR